MPTIEDEIAAQHAALMADYEATQEANRIATETYGMGSPEQQAAAVPFRASQKALDQHRTYWRAVGEATGAFVNRTHPGARVEMVKVQHNVTEG